MHLPVRSFLRNMFRRGDMVNERDFAHAGRSPYGVYRVEAGGIPAHFPAQHHNRLSPNMILRQHGLSAGVPAR
jgi:hypothetical protein